MIYYPYFIAKKSGTLEVRNSSVVIEAVKEDLWNLVTYSDREVTVICRNGSEKEFVGNREFLTESEQEEILKYVPEIKKLFRDDLLEGRAALLEWSYAVSCDRDKNLASEDYLVFYEARTVNA